MHGGAQTTNSMRRLKATFINQVDAHEGVGGGANSVDLVRLDAGRTLGLGGSVGLDLGGEGFCSRPRGPGGVGHWQDTWLRSVSRVI